MRKYPTIVSKLVTCFDAWLVGSAADPDVIAPRDYDVIISPREWNQAAQLIPKDAKVNTFGGWKFIDEGVEVDVWPEELNNFFTNHLSNHAYHPRSGTLLEASIR